MCRKLLTTHFHGAIVEKIKQKFGKSNVSKEMKREVDAIFCWIAVVMIEVAWFMSIRQDVFQAQQNAMERETRRKKTVPVAAFLGIW